MSDLFDFFKENENKLHERPPEQAWAKLEQKLERNRRPKRRGIRFMQLGVVALAILILLLAAGLVWYFVRKMG
ncbi:MAG: hypothetical protein KF734_06020 [Saprospiraceae bacterium]|nr:hypothetical protein [Saprospiraceae bacterium]MCW5921245.1 hypothetical protein [Saprospiraceae bacterium]